LDLRSGLATTTFTMDGVHYRRELFASAPGEVIVMRLMADAPQKNIVDGGYSRECI
jgi:alpha-L-fucosidase 2